MCSPFGQGVIGDLIGTQVVFCAETRFATYFAIALTVAAIQPGHTAPYRSAFDLAQDMAEAEATGTRKEVVAQLCKVDLLAL